LNKAKFGVFLPFYALKNVNQPDSSFDLLKSIVLECEHLGYNSVWLDDHLMYRNTSILECWTTLSALASVTHKIRLGTMVTSNGFRNPALLAKMAATVDVISNGRLEFGIGSGAQKEEHIAYGFKFPNPPARINRMQETIEILKKMWTQEKTSYDGKNYRIINAVCEPKPLQKPYPPITVGGSGEKYTLNVTAKYANRFDFGFLQDIEQFKHKLEVLENHCKRVGRDYTEIEKSCWPGGQILLEETPEKIDHVVQRFMPKNLSREDFEKCSLVGSPEECVGKIKSFRDLGVTNFMLFFGDLPDLCSLRLFAETVANKL
jgi:F420-dependent oxidoreductase-like protein